jgi:hypothetical protein
MIMDRKIQFVFVVNSLRPLITSAAQGILFFIAFWLKNKSKNFSTYLLVTHEVRGDQSFLVTTDINKAVQIIGYWVKRFSIPARDLREVFDGLAVKANMCSSDSFLNDFVRTQKLTKESTVFIFNNSYPCDDTANIVVDSDWLSWHIPMSVQETCDFRYTINQSVYVDSIIRIVSDKRRMKFLIPVRTPLNFGNVGVAPENWSTYHRREQKNYRLKVLTLAQRLEKKLTPDDWRSVILPTMLSTSVSWIFIGAKREDILASFRANTGELSEDEITGLEERIEVIEYVEDLVGIINSSVDILYKGSHIGGSTTIAACIFSGVPVVDFDYNDSRTFMPKASLVDSFEAAQKMVMSLVNSVSTAKTASRTQYECLSAYNDNSWSRDLFLVLNEAFSKVQT